MHRKPKYKGIIPSQNAIKSAHNLLKAVQYQSLADARFYELCGYNTEKDGCLNHAHDLGQIVQFLQERIVIQPK
jgi:hypothetical protein